MANDRPRQTKRLEFDAKLRQVPGVKKTYFQRPPKTGMEYNCILYSAKPDVRFRANNGIYLIGVEYTVTYIHNDPDDESVNYILTHFQYVRYDRQYISDELYHDVFIIFDY